MVKSLPMVILRDSLENVRLVYTCAIDLSNTVAIAECPRSLDFIGAFMCIATNRL